MTTVKSADPVAVPRVPVVVAVLDGKIRAETPYEALGIVKSVPGGRWDPKVKQWWWAASEHTALDLVTKLRSFAIPGKRVELMVSPEITALIARAEGLAAAASVKVDDAVPEINLDVLGQPPHWLHQRRAFHAARGQTAYLLAIGMGGGKSRVAIDLVRDQADQRVLIICPKNVVGVWPKQFGLYAGAAHHIVSPRKGTIAKRSAEIVAALDTQRTREECGAPEQQQPLVVVVNYEAAWREPMAKLLLDTQWDRVILDESHRIKKSTGKAARFCARLSSHARRRLALTGTPMPHSPLDVFGQYKFLDAGIFGGSFTTFRARYAILEELTYAQPFLNKFTGRMEYPVVVATDELGRPLYQREDELAEKMYRIAFRIADEELDAALGLEEPIHETRTCHLSPSAQKTYNALSDDLYAAVGTGEVRAANALTRLLRLQQVTSGHLPVEETDDDGFVERNVVEIDTAKRDELLDLLTDVEPGKPVVVVTRFTHDLDNVRWVAEKLDRTYAELSGRRHDALTEDSTLAAGVEIAGVQIQSGGVGVDFSASNICVLYSVGFSLGDYDQVLKRTHRPGQRNRVAYYHIIAEHTVDEKVYAALRERKNVVEYVLGLAE